MATARHVMQEHKISIIYVRCKSLPYTIYEGEIMSNSVKRTIKYLRDMFLYYYSLIDLEDML